jgi:hypothetical protein
MTRTLSILAAVAALAVSADAASAGTSQKPAKPSKASYTLENTMISGYAVSNSRQGLLLYNGHAGLGANAAGAPQSGPTGAAPAASQGIIMRDGGICDPIRHMGC